MPVTIGCKGACEAVFDGTSPSGTAIVNGEKHWFAKGAYIQTGNACSAAAEAGKQVGDGAPSKPETTCAPGETAGTLNGKVICYKQSDGTPSDSSKSQASSDTQKTKVTNPDGSVTETEVRTRVDANGNKETTTTTTTTRPDGSSTTTRQVDNPLPGSVLGGGGTGNGNGNGSTPGGGNSGDPDPGEPEKGECEKNPSSAGCGGQPANLGELYAEKGKTLSGVLGAARDQFMSSPIGSAAGNFFTVSNPGSCPTWNAHVAYFDAELTIDQFCSAWAIQAMALFKMAFLIVCSFFAWRVAVE